MEAKDAYAYFLPCSNKGASERMHPQAPTRVDA